MKGSAGYAERTYDCEGCGRQVTRRARPGSSYCSLDCYRRSPKPNRRTGEDRSCACGATFYVVAGRPAHQGRFCSRACHDAEQGAGRTAYTCRTCHGRFTWSPSRSRTHVVLYCSLACRDADPARREQLLAMNTAQQAGRTTRVESAGYALLDALGVEHLRQEPFLGRFTPDATVPSARLLIQLDGDYWHDRTGTSTEPRIRRRVALDRSQDAYAATCGWRVLRLWEGDLRDDPEGCAERVKQHLRPP